eukprot:scaffold54168_cov31-Prasinocladus_malaysianus.AAC.1
MSIPFYDLTNDCTDRVTESYAPTASAARATISCEAFFVRMGGAAGRTSAYSCVTAVRRS